MKSNMTRKAAVYLYGTLAGVLIEVTLNNYTFEYDDAYFNNKAKPGISLTLPKKQQKYQSPFLFPFFFNMLSEGSSRLIHEKLYNLEWSDHFGVLLATALYDVEGAITIKPL